MHLAAVDAWRYQFHLEVWVAIAVIVGLGLYVSRVVAPSAAQLPSVVDAGHGPITNRQRGFFWAGVIVFWAAADWPLHDIAEEYLYAAHMLQHMLLTFVMPPLFLLATPTWLAESLMTHARVRAVVDRVARPVFAGVLFNGLIALTHWSWLVNTTVRIGPFHYAVHLIVVTAAFIMWLPVVSPVPRHRMALPGQMIYLFLMSIIPTIPGAWLTFAENPVYKVYDRPDRLWGVSVADDQQIAGLIMKIGGGFYLWSIITYQFFTWSSRHAKADRAGIVITEKAVLTWTDVEDEFERLGPPVTEDRPSEL